MSKHVICDDSETDDEELQSCSKYFVKTKSDSELRDLNVNSRSSNCNIKDEILNDRNEESEGE